MGKSRTGARSGTLRLLPREDLLRTGDLDHAHWNYRRVLGPIQRTRFALAVSLLPATPVPRLLEIGYGSGVFLPALARHGQELFGIDIHARHDEVTAILRRHGVPVVLHRAAAESIPFGDRSMDAVVAVSALEFVQDLDCVCREVRRVLRSGGVFVAVTPGRSAWLDLGLRVLTGRSARRDFGSRREGLIATLERHFCVDARAGFPRFGRGPLRVYDALRLVP